MGVFDEIGTDSHERVVVGHDPSTGLRAIIAIYSTDLGPALGGTRLFPYPTDDAALTDVLRLSKAMAHKAAAAGLDFGGGKAVIIGDRSTVSDDLWHSYGRLVDSLGGAYITAEDVGTTTDDMRLIGEETKWVVGRSREDNGVGDPSPATARGVVRAMQAATHHLWGNDSLHGCRVAVQGVGKVGSALVGLLVEHGAVASDDNEGVDAGPLHGGFHRRPTVTVDVWVHAARPQHGAAPADDATHRLPVEGHGVAFHEALPPIEYADDIAVGRLSAADDGADDGVEPGTVTAGGKNADDRHQ